MTESQPSNEQDRVVSPRSPLRAVLLTLLMTGLGHIYCGELVAGLVWAAAGAFCGVISLWALATSPSHVFIASLPMWIATIAAVGHVWSVAKQTPRDYQMKPYNSWHVYVLFLLISSFGVAGHGMLVRTHIVMAYVIPVSDMEPTLHRGDRFLVDKTVYRKGPIRLSDLVVFKNPAEPQRAYIKRVVALAGDEVEIRDGQVLINDKPAPGTAGAVGGEPVAVDDFGPVVVPPHNCFVLGENLANSKDSRHFGPVPYATVMGKATVIFWPPHHWSKLSAAD